jgi:TonB family protein
MAVLVIVIHALTPTTKLLGQSLLAQQSQSTPTASTPQARSAVPAITPSPEAKAGQGLSSDLEKIGTNVRPSVIWVTVFDSKGNLLRTESGFFISADGRIVTTAHAIEGAVNAVAKTGDGGIYNVSGVLAASKELDLAILEAEVKPRKLVRFLELNKDPDLPVGTSVVAVGSGLAVNEGSPKEMTIAAQKADHLELAAATPVSSVGCPLVNESGAVVGVVTSAGEKTVARSSTALESLLSRVAADTHARWPTTAEASATPKPTPKPRIVYAPAPAFPPGVSQGGVAGTGRFRLSFDASGNATNVQVVRSTGNPYFDSAAIKTLRQWKSAPSQGWSATVPVTFQTR